MRNNLRFIKNVIYKLKRVYGEAVDLYKRTSSTYDVSSGKKTVTKTKVSVKRAVVLPQDLARKFLYDAVFLKSDRSFGYGALFAIGNRTVLVDRKDLPRNYVIELSDYLIVNQKRYEVKNVDELEGAFTYLLIVTELKGLELAQIVDQTEKDSISFREQILVNHSWTLSVSDILTITERVSK